MEKAEKETLFRIGEVAAMFHLSVGSLRHYEKCGLLQPEWIDEATGYRYYSTRQFECLHTIRYLRALDLPLEEIADFLKNRDVDKIQTMLHRQLEIVRQKQAALQVIERKIENRLRQLGDALSSEADTIRLVESPPQRIAWIRSRLSLRSYLDLETSIRRLEAGQKDTAVFLGKVGVGIAAEQLNAGEYTQYDRVFLLLDEVDSYEGETELLPPETCVAVRFCGSHAEAPLYYERLAAYLAAHGLEIAGFSREITMIDYGLTNDPSQFVTEIRIPVRPAAKPAP